MTQLVAMLTDFGTADIYVGVMKAVIHGICPQAQLIDLTHQIQPQNIRQGAFALMNAYRYFPPGTIFVVVVDPGVGSARRPVAVCAGGYTFVAPDNGVLSYALSELENYKAVEINNPNYRLPRVSHSFHGRDIFSPAAAYLAAGVQIEELGAPLEVLSPFPLPQLQVGEYVVHGEVLHIDHFGNLITSIGDCEWATPDEIVLTPRFGEEKQPLRIDRSAVVKVNERAFQGIVQTYSETDPGAWLAMIGSSGFLELAINQGNCALRLGAVIGDPVKVRRG